MIGANGTYGIAGLPQSVPSPWAQQFRLGRRVGFLHPPTDEFSVPWRLIQTILIQ